jgi:hypothetical protein
MSGIAGDGHLETGVYGSNPASPTAVVSAFAERWRRRREEEGDDNKLLKNSFLR